MSGPCDQLQAFVDGELEPIDAENFRHHLAGCETCQVGLQELLQLELLAKPSPEAADPVRGTRGRGPSRRVRWLLAAAAAAVAVLAVGLLTLFQPRPEALLPRFATRPIEARLTWSPADTWRPYAPLMGAGSAAPPVVPLAGFADLQARRDWRALAALSLTYQDATLTQEVLQGEPPSAERDSDLAALALASAPQDPGPALRAAERALAAHPGHPQALWNRALALQRLGLEHLAAESFEQVASLREPGWGEEASQRARALREQLEARRDAWEAAHQAMLELVDHPDAPLPLAQARQLSGIVRATFYDALLSAPTPQRARALLPLARVLDAIQHGHALEEDVGRVAARDFRRRGPLARDYARLVRGRLEDVDAFLEQLRGSGEEDLYLGAILLAGKEGSHLPELEAIARAWKDPWIQLRVQLARARDEWWRADQWWTAEQRLLSALRTCREERLSALCVQVELELTHLYTDLHRPAAVYEHAADGWSEATQDGEWQLGQALLSQVAQGARLRRELVEARDELEELLRYPPPAPEFESFESPAALHQALAEIAYLDFRMEDARRELEQAETGGAPLDLRGATMLALTARFRSEPGDEARIQQAIDERLRIDPRPAVRAYADYIRGIVAIERDRGAGQALLRSALREAEQLPPGNATAMKARAFSFTALIMDAGKAGGFEAALGLLAEGLETAAPERCALGVAVDQERTVLLVRGDRGQVLGRYDVSRASPLRSAAGLVSGWALEALRGCEQVDVLAPPPVQGLPGLLPPEVAWSYRTGRSERGAPPASRPLPLRVSGAVPPPWLKLESTQAVSTLIPEQPSAGTWLTGRQATPGAVLTAIEDPTDIEIVAHGLFDPVHFDGSYLVLSPDEDGRYALTADDVRRRRLRGAPLVFLVACGATRAAPFLHESFSLPNAFRQAGARAVFAAAVDIPTSAHKFFAAVRERIRAGASPARALRDERMLWHQQYPTEVWVDQGLLFD